LALDAHSIALQIICLGFQETSVKIMNVYTEMTL